MVRGEMAKGRIGYGRNGEKIGQNGKWVKWHWAKWEYTLQNEAPMVWLTMIVFNIPNIKMMMINTKTNNIPILQTQGYKAYSTTNGEDDTANNTQSKRYMHREMHESQSRSFRSSYTN
jgi:hypothetical protein